MAVAPTMSATEAAAELWWDARFSAFGERIPFKSLFFPLLLQACDEQQQPQELSQDELATIVKHCVAENAWMHDFVTKRDFVHFVARFGPVELTITKVVSCFCVNGELAPWFHGLLSRADADRVLAPTRNTGTTTTNSTIGDGSFVIRFSESHPRKFTLSYVKVHASGASVGRREMKNCLIENLGRAGYALSDSRARTYASIQSFIQRSAARLKYGVPSKLAKRCNTELAQLRALQDQQSSAYTAFSAETFDLSASSSPSSASTTPKRLGGRALLFASSPLHSSSNSNGSSAAAATDSYSGFSLDALAPPLAVTAKSIADDAYSDASHFFGDDALAAQETATAARTSVVSHFQSQQQQHVAVDVSTTDYGCFQASVVASPPALRKLLSPSSSTSAIAARPPLANAAHLLSPSRRQQLQQQQQQLQAESSAAASESQPADAYGTFESFASTFAGDSELLAQRNRLAVSFAKTHMAVSSSLSVTSTASTMSMSSSSVSMQSVGATADAYGSFANLTIDQPASDGNDDYGSFAVLIDETTADAVQLGPPPPLSPQRSLRTSASSFAQSPLLPAPTVSVPSVARFELPRSVAAMRVDSSSGADDYGSFAALASPPSISIASSFSSSDSVSTLLNAPIDSVDRRVSTLPDTQFFPLEAKNKESAVLAQASADALTTLTPTLEEEHTHSAACSALEELNAGMACYQQRRLDDALARFTHAQQVAKATDDKVVEARALGNLGTVYLDKQDAAQAVECYQRCLDITRSIQDAKRERTILNNLVLALMASEQFDRALACCAVQLETTTHEVNRRKIFSRMSLLREKAARANRERQAAAAAATVARACDL